MSKSKFPTYQSRSAAGVVGARPTALVWIVRQCINKQYRNCNIYYGAGYKTDQGSYPFMGHDIYILEITIRQNEIIIVIPEMQRCANWNCIIMVEQRDLRF